MSLARGAGRFLVVLGALGAGVALYVPVHEYAHCLSAWARTGSKAPCTVVLSRPGFSLPRDVPSGDMLAVPGSFEYASLSLSEGRASVQGTSSSDARDHAIIEAVAAGYVLLVVVGGGMWAAKGFAEPSSL